MTSKLYPHPNGPGTGPYATRPPFSAAPSKFSVPIIPKVSYKAFETPEEDRRPIKENEKWYRIFTTGY